MRWWLVVLLAVACAAKVSPEPAPSVAPEATASASEATPEVPMLPPVFTADQVRDAMPVGTVLRYKNNQHGTEWTERWAVVRADADTVTISFLQEGATGAGGEQTSTWAELSSHSVFPVAGTTVSDRTVTVPAGTFEVRTWTVRDGSAVLTYDFDLSHPGPPVRLVTSDDTGVVVVLELLERVVP